MEQGYGLPDVLFINFQARIPTIEENQMLNYIMILALEDGLSMPAVIFQFSMRQPLIHCTLTGVKNRAELRENLTAATAPLPESTWDELAALGITSSRYDGQPECARHPVQDGP